MKKRITGLLLCLMLFCSTILAGCSLVTKDMAKYLSTKVVELELKDGGGQMSITKKDLITAYNSYGYYYLQSGYSAEQALDQTIELLIRRRITIAQAEKFYPTLTEKEKTYLWTETSKALDENFNDYLDKVLGKTDSSSSSDSDQIKFDGYTKNARLEQEGNSFKIKIEKTPSQIIDEFKYDVARDYDKKEDKEIIYTNFIKNVNDSKSDNQAKALNDYYKALLKNEEGQKLSEDRSSVFAREIDRLYTVVYENYMIEKYQEYYTYDESNDANITAKQIVDLYASKVRSSYTKYEVENVTTYDNDMKSGANRIYYYKDEGTKFFKVAHILFKFTDEQTAEYKAIEEAFKTGEISTEQEKQQKLDALYSRVVPTAREKNDDGVYVEKENKAGFESNAQMLRDYIASEVAKGQTPFEKADIFNELIYKYNEDPGMFNPTDIYTIGVDSEGNAVSNFVENFNKGGIALYNKGNGQIGDISDLVYTENGIHVMFYAGPIQNIFSVTSNSFTLDEGAVSVLYNTRANILLDKTLFDSLYDELVYDNYAVFENLQMNELKNQYNITKYPDRYKDLI